MAVSAVLLHACPTRTENRKYPGEVQMKNRANRLLTTFVAVLVWSSSAYAGCTKAQISGTWETAFSSGNSCRLKLNAKGDIVTKNSVCFDPNLGAAAPDSGKLPAKSTCLANGNIVVQGVKIQLFVQIATDRSVAAGRYLVPSSGEKGSVVMVRVP